MRKKVKVGIIGCGNISWNYLHFASQLENIEVVACADLLMERAEARAKEFGVPRACTVRQLLADDEIEIVVNLTIPAAHYTGAMAALKAGKCVYNEKPLAVTRAQGKKLIDFARRKGLLVGCAPDTFMGDGIQTCRKLIDSGRIGEPVAATAFIMCHGHERWHLSPEFYYAKGGGPMFDMGPYYLTALVNLVGPVRSVAASAKITFPERIITSKPKLGKIIEVETPTHIAGIMNFANGAIGTIVTSYDVWGGEVPFIEIYGTKATLSVPDPNGFGGPVRILKAGKKEFVQVSLFHGCEVQGRAIGVSDMAEALLKGSKHRASGELAYHVLDVMQAFLESSRMRKTVRIRSTCERPAPVPLKRALPKQTK